MNEDCVKLPNGDFKMVAQGTKEALRFKHGDAVRFCNETWEYAMTSANSGLGCQDICAIGQGPHIVELTKYDEKGTPVVILKRCQHLEPFNQNMFVLCE